MMRMIGMGVHGERDTQSGAQQLFDLIDRQHFTGALNFAVHRQRGSTHHPSVDDGVHIGDFLHFILQPQRLRGGFGVLAVRLHIDSQDIILAPAGSNCTGVIPDGLTMGFRPQRP